MLRWSLCDNHSFAAPIYYTPPMHTTIPSTDHRPPPVATATDHRRYGTASGKIGLVQIARNAHADRWQIPNPDGLGGVSCLSAFDITSNGKMEILVGRDDGVVQVFRMDSVDDFPEEIFKMKFTSAITSILGGYVVHPARGEIVVTMFSGEVVR